MSDEEIKIPKIDLDSLELSKMKLPILVGLACVLLFFCVYTVDANENAVILRLGKYNATTEPGLHFKIPIIDSVYKVKVDYQYKQEFYWVLQKMKATILLMIYENRITFNNYLF